MHQSFLEVICDDESTPSVKATYTNAPKMICTVPTATKAA